MAGWGGSVSIQPGTEEQTTRCTAHSTWSRGTRGRTRLCPPARHPKHTCQMKSPLSGGGGGPTSFPELCPHRREAHEWARQATSPPHQEEAEILSTPGKSVVLCGWLLSLTEGTQPGQPRASPPGRSFKRIPTEHLLCARTPDGQVVKEAQGNHGRSHLESPSCKSPSGWPEAEGQGPGPLLVHSLLQRPLFQIRLMAPGSCASSGHRGFIPVNRKEESSSLTVLLALHWPN